MRATGELEVSAQTEDDGAVMALRHKTHRFGVQFHPESIATRGSHLLRNFLAAGTGK